MKHRLQLSNSASCFVSYIDNQTYKCKEKTAELTLVYQHRRRSYQQMNLEKTKVINSNNNSINRIHDESVKILSNALDITLRIE